MSTLEALDVRLLLALIADPRAQIGELSTTLGIARNTVQAHLRRLDRSGALRQGGREVDLAAITPSRSRWLTSMDRNATTS